MEYYSAIKRNKLVSHQKTRGTLQCILLHERSQCEKATECMVPTIRHYGKCRSTGTIYRSVSARAHGRERGVHQSSTGDFSVHETICTIL